MNLLRDKSLNIQFEAFHVFKVKTLQFEQTACAAGKFPLSALLEVKLSALCCLCLQVFVANPNKTQPIIDILLKNQTKLIDFLSNFQKDRTDDEQFNDEKTYLIKQIRDLKKPAS